MRSFIIMFRFIALLTVGCSKEDSEGDGYDGRGELWDVHVERNPFEKNGARYFNVTYSYKGSTEDLRELSRISFAQGTKLDTQIVTVLDHSHKEELIAQGKYEQREQGHYGIIYMDLKHIDNNEFTIAYRYKEGNKDDDTFKAIDSDRINMQIQWYKGQDEYKDEVTIKGE